MREPENDSPAEVVRAKRLEIVDDEGKVRAVLGTDEQGSGSLVAAFITGAALVALVALLVAVRRRGW
jgi:hypothetical protein